MPFDDLFRKASFAVTHPCPECTRYKLRTTIVRNQDNTATMTLHCELCTYTVTSTITEEQCAALDQLAQRERKRH